jgi:integrase
MMTYHLFRVGKVWHYRFQVRGARTQRSTGERVRGRAEQLAGLAYRDALLKSGANCNCPTLRELVRLWLDAHRQTASASHVQGVEIFGRLHLYSLADTAISNLTTAKIEEARNLHLGTHAPNSANHWSRIIRLLCKWAAHRGMIDAVPFTVKMLKVQRKPRATLPVSLSLDWLRTLDELGRQPVQIAVRLMLGMGLREAEAASARWEWLDAARQTYTPGQTKGREAEPIPVPAWLIDYLRPFRKPTGLIVARADGRAFGRGFTRASIAIASRHIGIDRITPHRLRGTFATLLSENGAPVQVVQKVMRHKSVLTTVGYLESDLTHAAKAQQRIAEKCGFA